MFTIIKLRRKIPEKIFEKRFHTIGKRTILKLKSIKGAYNP